MGLFNLIKKVFCVKDEYHATRIKPPFRKEVEGKLEPIIKANEVQRDIAWGNHVSDVFVQGLIEICDNFNWPHSCVNDLLSCMAFESAETFSPSITNFGGSGATGLIQFMPRTAKGLGTTVEELACMTAVEQLKYVELYFKPYAHRINTLQDMYMAILLPKYVGKPNDTVIISKDVNAVRYRYNEGLDVNSNGEITKAEASKKVFDKLEKGLLDENKRKVTIIDKA